MVRAQSLFLIWTHTSLSSLFVSNRHLCHSFLTLLAFPLSSPLQFCPMSDNLSFDELMDLPLADSSPLKEPSHANSPVPGPTVPNHPESPSPLPGNVVPFRQKRPAEDMSQFAGEVYRAHKLPRAEHDELATYSKMGHAEQSIAMMGHILALKRQQSLIMLADAAWVVPKRLHNKISDHAAILITDSSIPAYRDDTIGPSQLLTDMVLANPDWGFQVGSHLKSEKDAMDTLASEVSTVLTAKRNTIKGVIISSLGSSPSEGSERRTGALDIVELSHLIITKLKVRVKVDLRLCGRVAILVCSPTINETCFTCNALYVKCRARYKSA
ncbi:hypothetical protein MSAN_01119900 [Mycena sanguinolenta]|uniref:Uncharacterized protein n=1 Tax=Mycena sanguinolenta TaxID=230812 RepID=A0A8H6YKT9_9AGAR|nr:hypothetical protein MSAN_01119900 [Mycena sanguinolenta]